MNISKYLRFNKNVLPPKGSIIIVTSTIDVSPVFIIHHFISTSIQNGQTVVLVSFLNDFQEILFLSRKWGFDFTSKTCFEKLVYVDGLTKLYGYHLGEGSIKNTFIRTVYIELTGESNIDDIFSVISSGIKQVSSSDVMPSLILWGADFLVANEILTPSELLSLIIILQEMVHCCVITLNADSAFWSQKKRLSDLEVNYSVFSHAIIYRAYSIISLRPLPSGRTKDVTGIIRVSRGSGYYTTQEDDKPDTSNYDESGNSQFEMLYSVHDSGAQIFPKGTF